MLNSLRTRLGLLFFAFLFLVIASAAITFVTVESQRNDALLINLAGRQRMLSQQMTWLALAAPDALASAAARQRFDQTLTALRMGGPTLDIYDQPVVLPQIADPVIQARLADTWRSWQIFTAELDRIAMRATADADDAETAAPAALTVAALALLDNLDRVVALLAEDAQAKVHRLQVIQTIFLLLALLLLWLGYWVTRRHVVDPLASLGASAQQMAAGELEQTVPTFGDVELRQLADTLESMRREVLAGRRQLEARVRQRTRELTTAFELSQEIAAQLELTHLLDSVTDRARSLMAGTAAALCLLDEGEALLRLAASSGNGQAKPDLRQPVTAELPSRVIGEGRTVVMQAACANCGFLRGLASGQCVVTPLRAGGNTLGALCVVRPAAATFETEEQAALALLANAAAVAIVNARLVEAGRRQAQATAAQDERERLAADLHDNLAQTLSFLNLKADRLEELIASSVETEAARELAQMRGATARAYGQVRAALTGLHAPAADSSELAGHLRACVEEMCAATGLPVELAIDAAGALALSPVAQQQVLHIVREALTNAWRHAAAQRVTVRAEWADGVARFSVGDDGRGFDPETVDESMHLGLAIMRARAERSGGALAVHAQPGAGTQVALSFRCLKLGGEG